MGRAFLSYFGLPAHGGSLPIAPTCCSATAVCASDTLYLPFVLCQAKFMGFFLRMFQCVLQKAQPTMEYFKDLANASCKNQVNMIAYVSPLPREKIVFSCMNTKEILLLLDFMVYFSGRDYRQLNYVCKCVQLLGWLLGSFIVEFGIKLKKVKQNNNNNNN